MVLTSGPTCVVVPTVVLRRSSMNVGSTGSVKTEGDGPQGIFLTSPQLK